MANKDGRSKVVYINDADGNRIGGYVIHYDKDGREIGRVSWDEKPPPPPEVGAGADGHYDGTVTFHARPAKEVTGTLSLDVRGGKVKGVLTAKYQKPWPGVVHAEITGTISSDLRITATIKGTSRYPDDTVRLGILKASNYPFLGTNQFTGQLLGGRAQGSFAAAGQRHDSYDALGHPMVRCATAAAECASWVDGSWSIPRTRPMSRLPPPKPASPATGAGRPVRNHVGGESRRRRTRERR